MYGRVYDVTRNPKYISGQKEEDELLLEFLASFDTPGQCDGKVKNMCTVPGVGNAGCQANSGR